MKKMSLDAIDIRILCAVQQHGKMSKAKLAEWVDLSPTPCWVRLAKLEKAGFIKGYHAQIDLDRMIDLTKVIVTISLKAHSQADFHLFESYIQKVDEIVECYATGGGSDYVLKIITHNLKSFQALIEQLLNEEIGIDRYFIYIVTKQVKHSDPNVTHLMKQSC